MSEKKAILPPEWDDDDVPEWPEELWDMAEISIGDKIIRKATGSLTLPGRPPMGEAAKRQITLRLDPDVIDKFREGGAGWQSRMNAALRKAAGLV